MAGAPGPRARAKAWSGASSGVREWLGELAVRPGLRCATFDTKVLTPRLPGSAAKAIDKRLRSSGAVRVRPPRTFSVHGKSGGLVDGELDAARAWAGTFDAGTSALPCP